ncbi:MAG: tetratricopeptide repeat protein [Proteobacteria bacterium]|nr:tetratricopeptide repeat protein [Pseudomonadota bacterium]
MTQDLLGNPLSYADTDAVAACDAATEKLLAYRADPLADIDPVIAAHPRFAMAKLFRAGLIATAGDTALDALFKAAFDDAAALAPEMNDRERAHLAALDAWREGRFAAAADRWGRILFDHPRDTTALQFAHLADFYVGQAAMLRDRPSWALRAFGGTTPRRNFVLGMRAFGLEENGQYDAARALGAEAVAAAPHDAWAVHAVAHVYEMRGETDAGITWLETTQSGWAPENLFAFHNWWHLALLRLDRGEADAALALYDTRVRPSDSDAALEMVDGSALLWRIWTRGGEVGERWSKLAALWESRIGHGGYAFNDVHATMAFVGAGRFDLARTQIETLRKAARGTGDNAAMSAQVGLPVAQALLAFGQGDWRNSADLLIGARAHAIRFGGSNAQRDVLVWTATEAALRAGDAAMAQALIAERRTAKPDSRISLDWARRAA